MGDLNRVQGLRKGNSLSRLLNEVLNRLHEEDNHSSALILLPKTVCHRDFTQQGPYS